MRYLIVCIVIVLTLIFYGCSGGFDSDSSNAEDLEQSIFGPDTTAK